MSAITADAVANMFGINVKTVQCQNTETFKKANLGGGLFDYHAIVDIKDVREKKDWFKKEVRLFIEYLNKIWGISYNKMSKRIKAPINSIASGLLGYEYCVVLLVKYQYYTPYYDRYYGYIKEK